MAEYDDTKAAMGMGPSLLGSASNSVTNLKNDFLNLANVLESTVMPKIKILSETLNETSDKLGKIMGADTSSGANRVAPAPPKGGGGGAGGAPAAPGTGGMAGGSRIAVGALAAVNGMQYLASALPSVSNSVMQDFLTQRSAFFGQGGYGGTIQSQTAQVNSLQKMMARNGVAINSMDTTNALAAAQATGLSGANNFSSLMGGIATASQFSPGMGMAQIAGAVGGTMNAAMTVNLAKTIGINIRDANGNVMSPDKLADQIWSYISRVAGSKPLTKKDIQVSLMPGNGLYGMLNGLFSNDPTMFTIMSNMLLAKAQFGGADLSSLSRSQQIQAGIMSGTTNAIANQVSAQTNLLTSTAAAAAGGYAGAADIGAGMNNLAAKMSDLTAVLAGASAFSVGMMGLGGGALGKGVKGALGAKAGQNILSKILGIFKNPVTAAETGGDTAFLDAIMADIAGGAIVGLATGGPAQGNTPYVVGEVGPELFVPKTDGYVIPNHALGLNRAGGGPVKAGGASGFSQSDFASALLKGLGVSSPAQQAIQDIIMWEGKEGGNWINSAKYNPLNTSYQLNGSVNFDTGKAGGGVQAYTSWDQGVAATVNTLTGLNAKSRGYTAIVDALKKGGVSSADFLKLMQASNWDKGHYGGGTSSSGTGGVATPTAATQTSSGAISNLSSLIASTLGGTVATPAAPTNNQTNYNYGGVNITIQADKNPQATAAAVKKALKDTSTATAVGNG